MDNNVQIIKKSLINIISSTTPQQSRKNLQLLGSNIDLYLNQLENFYSTMENVSPIISQYQSMNASKISTTYAIYKRLVYNQDQIQNLLKDGYRILDIIRTFFTNQTIKYEIGLIKGGTLYETELTLEQLLKNSSVVYNTKSKVDNVFKLRMSGGKQSILKTYQQAQRIVASDVSDSSTVFSAIYDYVKTENSHGRKINKGNAYQAYKRIVAQRGNDIPPSVSIQLIEQTLTDIRGNTASSVQGGDYLTSQIKFYSSAPSLVTTSLIRTTLTQVKDNLLKLSNSDQDFKEGIRKIFIKDSDKVADKAEDQARKEAEEYLTQFLQSLGLDVS